MSLTVQSPKHLDYYCVTIAMFYLAQTGHLVHVKVTIFDSNDDPVMNLGLVNPWLCEASLQVSRRSSEDR